MFAPKISLCKVVRYPESVSNKKAKPYDEKKAFAPLKREPNAFFQHFQAWEWVEYSAISESHRTFFSHQADFLRNEVMTKPSRI